jgi:hypothetical protein
MMGLSNLFASRLLGGRTESVHDYAGVLVSLEEAHLHSHSARTGKCEFEEARDDNEEESDRLVDEEGAAKDGEHEDNEEGAGMLQMSAAEYTIEGLRRAVRKDEKGGQKATEYECEYWRYFKQLLMKIGLHHMLMLRGSKIKAHK